MQSSGKTRQPCTDRNENGGRGLGRFDYSGENITPRPKIQFGSTARLSSRHPRSRAGGAISSRCFAFNRPIPCSADTVPPMATAALASSKYSSRDRAGQRKPRRFRRGLDRAKGVAGAFWPGGADVHELAGAPIPSVGRGLAHVAQAAVAAGAGGGSRCRDHLVRRGGEGAPSVRSGPRSRFLVRGYGRRGSVRAGFAGAERKRHLDVLLAAALRLGAENLSFQLSKL